MKSTLKINTWGLTDRQWRRGGSRGDRCQKQQDTGGNLHDECGFILAFLRGQDRGLKIGQPLYLEALPKS